MANLVELFDNIVQMQNLNGVPLANGKMYVYALGRTRLMDTWSDVDGVSLNSNPIILDAAGQCHCYVSDDFDYTLVVTDAYDNEIFSIDKYLYSQGSHSHADVAVAPSETIAVSSYHVGETTVYVPYLTGQLGKVYTGIDPIVVNNTEDKISANHVPLGVQDPLYFVQDDEEACIIGFSGQTVPEGVMTESALGFENNKITGYNGSAFSAGNEYEAGSYVDITDNTISVTGLQPEGDYAYNSALSSKLDVTATGQFLTGLPEDLMYSGDMTAYQPAGDYQTAGNYQTAGDYLSASDSANFLLTGDSANFLLTSDSGNFYPMEGNPSGFLTAHQSLDGYATEQWVENKGYLTGVDIPESANWNSTYNTVHDNSASWTGGTANPQIPVTSTSGISIFESGDKVYFNISADYATHDDVESATSGKADTSGVIDYFDKPSTNDYGSVWASGGKLHAGYTAEAAYLYASGDNVHYTNVSPTQIWTISGGENTIDIQKLKATTNGFTAAGIVLSQNSAEISGGSYYGIQFRTPNTAMASAGLYYSANQNVPRYSPLFSAKNVSGDGFAIWAGGARGFDASGNVIWDAAAPAKLIGWANYQGTAIDPRAAGINGSIIATMYPDNVPGSYLISSIPHAYINGYGFFANNPYSISITADTNNGIILGHTGAKTTAAMNNSDVSFTKYNNATSASDIWSLTGSVQKREIECDSATSAITAIAGSAIGGGGADLDYGYHDTAISSIDNSALYDNSAHARINTLAGRISNLSSNKLDTTAFSDVSGTFLTDDNTVVLEYGTSTWAEFKAAYDAHKNIVMYQRDIGDITNTYATFGYVDFDGEPYAASFTTVCYGTEYRFTLNSNNVWQSYTQMYQARGNYYSASNPSGFVTSGELPDPITIGVQEGDTLDTDYDGLKIVKATANGNEHINLHKKSTDQWLIHGNLVPTSPGSNKYLVTDDSGAMHWDNKSALAYDSAFEQSGGMITAYNGSAFKAGDEFPQSATEAIETVTANSADWNGTTETVSSNSGAWGGSALPISAGPGIALNLVDGVLVISTAGE